MKTAHFQQALELEIGRVHVESKLGEFWDELYDRGSRKCVLKVIKGCSRSGPGWLRDEDR